MTTIPSHWTALCLLAAAASVAPAQAQDGAILTLQQAVERGLDDHPAIGVARAQAAEAGAQVTEARGAWLPALSAQGGLTQYQEPMVVAPLHGFDPTNPPAFESGLVQGGVQVTYTVFDGGARGARVRGARALEGAADAGQAVAEAQVVADVTEAYLRVLTADELVAALDQGLAALGAERDRVEQLLTEGQAARVDLLRIEAALAQAEAERIAASSGREVAERALARLVAAGDDQTRAARLRPVRLRRAHAPLDPGSGGPSERPPELVQADAYRRAAEAGQRAARSAWLPRFDVAGAYLLFGSTAGAFASEWQAGVRMSYPLFTGGTRAGAVARAEAQVDAAAARYRLLRLQVDSDRDRAAAAVAEHHARVAATATAVGHLEEVARIERLALDAGALTQPEYLRAEADLRQARAAHIRARYDEILAVTRLARATGVLTAAWIDETLETLP